MLPVGFPLQWSKQAVPPKVSAPSSSSSSSSQSQTTTKEDGNHPGSVSQDNEEQQAVDMEAEAEDPKDEDTPADERTAKRRKGVWNPWAPSF